jgi:MinD-like ATPase involved in chromosome partitioning or flagellar assembly
MAGRGGQVITFYSYKGGSGRTMALANVAWVLASNGYDVLLIDWDLEAPGLHRYLRPFLIDPELESTSGLIDFLWDAAQVSMTPPDEMKSSARQFPTLSDYVVGLRWKFNGPGSISFIPAGCQDDNYAQRVNGFNWSNFYERLGGGKLLHEERERLKERYHYILIDSRTGVSDTSGVCTVQMPDIVVAFFTLNRQGIDGCAAVAKSIAAAVEAYRGESIKIYPVPTRIENAEAEKLEAAIGYARRLFSPLLMHVQSNRREPNLQEQAEYWKGVETPYIPYYAYEEVPAAFREEPGSRRGILAPNERITYWITDRVVSELQRQDGKDSQRVVQAYAFSEEGLPQITQVNSDRNSFIRVWLDRMVWELARRRWQYVALGAIIIGLLSAVWVFNLQIRLENARAQVSDLRRQNGDLFGRLQNQSALTQQKLDEIIKQNRSKLGGSGQ